MIHTRVGFVNFSLLIFKILQNTILKYYFITLIIKIFITRINRAFRILDLH